MTRIPPAVPAPAPKASAPDTHVPARQRTERATGNPDNAGQAGEPATERKRQGTMTRQQ